MNFPKNFHFGSATSAYQVEGAVNEDGRGPSIWDDFCATPSNIRDGSDGRVACDHYHRYADDIARMAEMGFNAYRFSVAWPRILPEGRGRINPAGLAFYDRLVDGLLAKGIAPYLTLYHWDLPSPLQAQGGWGNRETAWAFAEYAEVIGRHFGDRVHAYATLNEPRCAAFVGHYEGRHAPGATDLRLTLQVAHHLMLAHGAAVQRLRAHTQTAKVGIVLDMKPYHPANDHPLTARAAEMGGGIFNRWLLDVLFKGHYPADVWEGFGPLVPHVEADDYALIQQPLDNLGINYYTRALVEYDPELPFPHAREVRNEGAIYSTMNWEFYPEGLEEILGWIHRTYGVKELYIAENGVALADEVVDGRVHDPLRTQYYQTHLAAVSRAITQGVPLTGYLAWSLMDNFEWGQGYLQRFGLWHVDYATQERILKDSAHWYADFIKTDRGKR